MRSKLVISSLVLALGSVGLRHAQARPFRIAAPSNPALTTQTLRSGDFILGISDLGGGYINKLVIPDHGDIMGSASKRYGRGGQSAMRDYMHAGAYNPTQAGYTDMDGTQCQIVTKPGLLVITPHKCRLWWADGKYDFTNRHRTPAQEARKITSEFDYYGYYQNVDGTNGITISCIKHYFEYRFIRKPGFCFRQFGPGTPVFRPYNALKDIPVKHPVGVYPAQPFDLSKALVVWSLRGDTAIWNPRWVYYLKKSGTWDIHRRRDNTHHLVYGSNATYQPLIIISDSKDPSTGKALGVFRPNSVINTNIIVGRKDNGSQVYADPRLTRVIAADIPHRIESMWKLGFFIYFRGMLNRTQTPPGVYETFRTEVYMLVGTPNQIRNAAAIITRSSANTRR
ncbi:MAG: hypothetical protein HKL96_10840 [Phycisphaerales bacterium]|nr:hypothetical protein [Phycisphaerales bacterium]